MIIPRMICLFFRNIYCRAGHIASTLKMYYPKGEQNQAEQGNDQRVTPSVALDPGLLIIFLYNTYHIEKGDIRQDSQHNIVKQKNCFEYKRVYSVRILHYIH